MSMEAGRLLRTSLPILAVILAALAIASIAFLVIQRLSISHLADGKAGFRADAVPLRFTVLSRSDFSISANFRFYDSEGREIAAFERSWNGSELYIESIVETIGGRFFLFPAAVYTSASGTARGTDLFPYYDSGGFPSIFDSAGIDGSLLFSFRSLFSRVKSFRRNPDAPGPASGGAFRDLRRLVDPEVGAEYALSVGADGGVELSKE